MPEFISASTATSISQSVPLPQQSDPDRGPSRRSVLTTAAALTGAVVLGSAGTAVAGGTAAPSSAANRRWIRLKLAGAGKGKPISVTINPPENGDPEQAKKCRCKVWTVGGNAAVSRSRDDVGGTTSVEVESRGKPGVVWVRPLKTSRPGEPADTLVIESPAGREEIDIWIEPEAGHWFPAGPTLGVLDLGIVAMHAALLRKPEGGAEVLMYASPRKRDQSGQFIPNADRPGQWEWDIFAQNDVEARSLDLASYTTGDRPMAQEVVKNIFCSGQTVLPDGRLLTAGGHRTTEDSPGHNVHNSDALFIYDPAAHDRGAPSSWTKLSAKLDPLRWYPTLTVLPDGMVLIASGATVLPKVVPPGVDAGKNGFWNQIVNEYLIFDPKRQFFTARNALIDLLKLDPINQKLRDSGADPVHDLRFQQLATFPNIFVVPGRKNTDTRLLMAESNRAWLYTYLSGEAAPLRWADRFYPMRTKGSRSYPHYGNAVLLPLGPHTGTARVLALGGQHEDNPEHRSFDPQQPATNTAEIFDIDPDADISRQKGWRPAGRMRHPRVLCDATLLADGKVLISGGSRRGWGDNNNEAVYESELFDPDTEKFYPAASAATDRRYHSTALLEPDGTLFKAGSTGGFGDRATGTDRFMQVHTTAERYYPPYLWRGPRPAITRVDPGWSATAETDLFHGNKYLVRATGPSLDGRARVALIQPGAMTHGNNMSQRFVWLDVPRQSRDGDRWSISVTIPANPAAAPPGDYMLVIVDSDGVPSPAKFVRLAVPAK